MGSGINVVETKTEESKTKLAQPTENGAYRSNTWETEVTSYKGPGRHHPITFSIDGFGYVIGGNYPKSSLQYLAVKYWLSDKTGIIKGHLF